jgi:hypothetical protein
VRPKSSLSGTARVYAARAFPVLGICEDCGLLPAANRHHLDGDEWNNVRTNVAFLCTTCHGIRHRKTHCQRGHPLTDDNVYLYPTGARACRMCRRLHG